MSQLPSSENPEKSTSNQPFYLPRHYSHWDYHPGISDSPTKGDENLENGEDDGDSFGDLILFI